MVGEGGQGAGVEGPEDMGTRMPQGHRGGAHGDMEDVEMGDRGTSG